LLPTGLDKHQLMCAACCFLHPTLLSELASKTTRQHATRVVLYLSGMLHYTPAPEVTRTRHSTPL
jgi:hypothetical protein